MLRQTLGNGRLYQALTLERRGLDISAPFSTPVFEPVVNDTIDIDDRVLLTGTKFFYRATIADTIGVSDQFTPSAPTIVSLNYTVGDTDGFGQPVVITGTSMGSVTAVTFGGTAATITAVTSSTVTVVLPQHAAGLVNVVVTNPAGSSTATNAFEYWSPTALPDAELVLDAAIGITTDGNGNVSAWIDRTSNAYSYGNTDPSERPLLAGIAFGDPMNGVRFAQEDSLGDEDVPYLTTYSVFVVAQWSSSDTTETNVTSNVPLTMIADGGQGALGASAGVLAVRGNSFSRQERGSGLNDGAPRMLGVTFNGDGEYVMKAYVGETQQGSNLSANGFSNFSVRQIGANLGLDGFDGDIAAVIAMSSVISGGNLTKLYNWAKQRWGVA